jgi:hypothetical protein
VRDIVGKEEKELHSFQSLNMKDGGKFSTKFGKSNDYGAYGFFEAGTVPSRPCYGYGRELEAGIKICRDAIANKTSFVLVFGIPGTGKTLFPCTLVNRLNSQSTSRLPLAFLQCDPVYWGKNELEALPKFIEFLQKRTQLVIHLVELDKAFGPERDEWSVCEASLFRRCFRNLFTDEPKKSLVIATASYPDRIDDAFWVRFDSVIYIGPTNKQNVVQIISELLKRDDSSRIAEILLESFSNFDPALIPLGREVIRACKLLLNQRGDVSKADPAEIAVLLRHFISPFPKQIVDEYETKYKSLIIKSNQQIEHWPKTSQTVPL